MVAATPEADWREVADTLANVIDSMGWIFAWGVAGKLSGHDWLQCNSCDELQLLPKAKGAPSQKPKCHMTLNCKGTYRRMPEIFDVTKPKKPRKKKPAPLPVPTPDASRRSLETFFDTSGRGEDENWDAA